ncbi:MAG: endonuclease MutS2 [Brevinema sp.]
MMNEELNIIISTFHQFLSGERAKKLFDSTFFGSVEDLEEHIAQSNEISRFAEECQSLYFQEIPDAFDQIDLSLKEYVLDQKDIYHLYLNLQQWDEIRQVEIISDEYPILHQIVHEPFMPKTLLALWENSFDEHGNIADGASPELRRIRGLKKQLRTKIEKSLQKELASNDDLAEQRIAFREDRYVLPIKSVAKNRTEGIIHGFSTSGMVTYIEPPAIVALNNELLSVDDLEYQEINRLLRTWSKQIANNESALKEIVERSAMLEVLFGQHYFAKKYQCSFANINLNKEIVLERVYNPFILIKKGIKDTVPIDLEIKNNTKGVIISGPNAGGKSASLKTIALCLKMFRKGLPIPSRYAELPFFDEIYMEIGDSQSLSDELSTFSGHIIHLKEILEQCTEDSLVLIDEIAHATDPVEGEVLGCAIIDRLIEKNTLFLITTHYKKVKIKAFEHKNILTCSTSFNTETLTSEFRLYPDTIGESYALKIATRVGLDASIIEKAQGLLKEQQDKTDQILSNIEEFENRLRRKEIDLAKIEQELTQKEQQIQKLQSELDEQKVSLVEQGLQVADKELFSCLQELAAIQRNLAQQPKEKSQQVKEIRSKIDQKKSQIVERSRNKKQDVQLKDLVFVASLNKKGVVEQITKSHVVVNIGNIKINVSPSDLFEVADHEKPKNKAIIQKDSLAVSHTIDVHGMISEDAIRAVEQALYAAMVAGLKEFTIVHGKGTGILQKNIHLFLKQVPEIKEFGFAPPQLGGSGKTIVTFI